MTTKEAFLILHHYFEADRKRRRSQLRDRPNKQPYIDAMAEIAQAEEAVKVLTLDAETTRPTQPALF